MATLTIAEVGGPAVPLVGGRVMRLLSFTCDTDYPSGGYALNAAQCGMTTIEQVIAPPASGYVFEWLASKLLAYIGNYDASDGPLIETSVGDNGLDGVVTRILVIGTK